jgi:hypothetical protein
MLKKRHGDLRRQMDQKTRFNGSISAESDVARPRLDSLEAN